MLAAVGVGQERGDGYAEHGRGGGQFPGADAPQAGGARAEGGRLTVGEAQHAAAGSCTGEGGQYDAEAEGLVIRMGADGQNPRQARQLAVGPRTRRAWRAGTVHWACLVVRDRHACCCAARMSGPSAQPVLL